MNDEEKYKKALEKAKALYSSSEPMSGCSVILETIFPELAESEDKKIKNRLIKLIKMSNEVGGFALHKWEADEMLTWLEKQCEKKYTQKDVDNAYLKGVSTTKRMFEKQKAKKEAEQKPVWSENDERICQCLIRKQEEQEESVENPMLKEIYRERMDWLKSLEGRVQSQK